MKCFIVLASILSLAAATNPFLQRADASCNCDVSMCPPLGGPGGEAVSYISHFPPYPLLTAVQHCKCVSAMIDKCYVEQTHAGVDCGTPTYPDGCKGGETPIKDMACGGTSGGDCSTNEICYFPDKNCDPHTTKCTGLCANDYCGGTWEKECPDSRWSCVQEDSCLKSGATDCDGQCVLN
jgi:hypothetical protein